MDSIKILTNESGYSKNLIKFFKRRDLSTETYSNFLFIVLNINALHETTTKCLVEYLEHVPKIMILADQNKFLDALTTIASNGNPANSWAETFIGELLESALSSENSNHKLTELFSLLISTLHRNKLLKYVLN
ncbi:MAG: hypothetical protein N3E37_02350 [Candidatus Micrarchaeota archaeon]|nr:hypothetical protein [Candidatus Micrarchaeota archaeon]